MQIPQTLPQFNGQNALLMITGRRVGRLLFAHNGEITEIDHFEIPVPKYSDNEGFFESRGHGQVIRSGAVREISDQNLGNRFLKSLKAKLTQLIRKNHITDIYIFSPREHEIENQLSPSIRARLQATFIGSYMHTSIKKLLSMIQQKHIMRLVLPISDEALKMLRKHK